MSYTPTVWATGDVVTATKLNKLENGVANANASNFVTITQVYNDSISGYDHVMNKTAGEIWSMALAGPVILTEAVEASGYDPSGTYICILTGMGLGNSGYTFQTSEKELYVAELGTDYPIMYAGR